MKIKILLLLIVTLAVVYAGYRINYKPYDVSVELTLVPTFTKVKLDFVHEFKSQYSLPFLGSAVLDINNDDIPEVFLGGGYLQRDGLYVYRDGYFEDISAESGFSKEIGDSTYGAASVDVNKDGYSDLFVARDSGLYLYINQQGFFVKQKLAVEFDPVSVPLSIALGDINLDGHVEMFVSSFLKPEYLRGQVFNDPDYGADSLLLLNNGNNTFTDITKSSGLGYRHNTFTALFADLNADSRADLVVAYNTGQPRIYKNLGNNLFENIPLPVSDSFSFPMGIAAGDYNNDSRLDLLFTNIGTTIPPFLAKGDLTQGQTLNTRWMLLQNDGDFKFTDVAENVKVANYEFGWGAVFEDMNLDGLQDLIVATNYIKFPPHLVYRSPGKLLLQTSDRLFAPAEKPAGVENRRFGMTPLVADFNADGYPDLVQVNLDGPAVAYINNGGNRKFAKVLLNDTPAALGAKITLESNGIEYTRYRISGEGLASDQTRAVTFGLDQNTTISRVQVRYLGGKTLTVEKPGINQIIDFREKLAPPVPIASDLSKELSKALSKDEPDEKPQPPAEEVRRPAPSPTLEDELELLLSE